jgi:hypothetical protein
MTADAWDRIYTINKYYDGPELGVADYRGRPHIYEKQFDIDEDEYTNRFLLSPIDPALFLWVQEDWEIWLRWNAAYREGKADVKTHPALPEDRQRHAELAQLIGDRLKPDSQHGFSKWARFEPRGLWALEVQWLDTPLEPDWNGG